MATDQKYLLDADVFIQAHKAHFRFSFCPGFWESLLSSHRDGVIFSVDKVGQEIEAGKDELADWVQANLSSGFFLPTNNVSTVNAYRDIQQWAQDQAQFSEPAKEEFANNADGWLVAHARANGFIVVTHEVYNRDIKKRIPIPNACNGLGVRFINPFAMLDNLGIKLIREK